MSQITDDLHNGLDTTPENQASKYMTIDPNVMPSLDGRQEILSQSREATSYKSNRIVNPIQRNQTGSKYLKALKKSPDSKQYEQHIRIPV